MINVLKVTVKAMEQWYVRYHQVILYTQVYTVSNWGIQEKTKLKDNAKTIVAKKWRMWYDPKSVSQPFFGP